MNNRSYRSYTKDTVGAIAISDGDVIGVIFPFYLPKISETVIQALRNKMIVSPVKEEGQRILKYLNQTDCRVVSLIHNTGFSPSELFRQVMNIPYCGYSSKDIVDFPSPRYNVAIDHLVVESLFMSRCYRKMHPAWVSSPLSLKLS